MREKVIQIIDDNYDSDTGELDKCAIVDEILEFLKIKDKYTIGIIEDPFNTLSDD